MDPLTSDIAIPEPDIEKVSPAEHEIASKAEESSPISASEPRTSYIIEAIPAPIDHSSHTETGSRDDENAINQSDTMELQSELEPSATEPEHTVEEKTDVSDAEASNSAPILAVAQQLPEVSSQEIIQPQSTAVSEDDLDNRENQFVNITSSTKLEEHGTAENIEAKDYVDIEVELTCFW